MRRFGLEHSLAEHIADGVMHALGVVFAIAGATALLVWAALSVPAERLWPLVPYAAGLIATFALSAAYNMTLHRRLRAVLRRFDHAAIYLMIAGTYTPLALIGIGGGRGVALALAAWALAAVGIVLKLAFFQRWPRLGFGLYLAQGWLGLLALWPMIERLPPAALALIFGGGVIFTVGTIFYARGWRFSTAIWHGHVLAAAALHYVAVIVIAGTV
ncbi:MAG: hemolysin III family protein [Alphaproteobacteria bacterium]|nr:MAG: hemolysin III family protein [Alphaproteobacteria bacterium]